MHANPQRSFWQKSNDLQCRGLAYRFNRFLRSRLQNLCQNGILFAQDPRVLRAWKNRWDADHFVRLQRWRDQGFEPRVIYDIGAHAGRWSVMCHSIFGPIEHILFEPQPDLFRKAQAAQPGGAKWRVLPLALGSAEKTELLHITENEAASSLLSPAPNGVPTNWGTQSVAQTEVQIATLDGLIAREQLPKPDLVKIDVQGYESHVIAGGRNTLANARALIVEVSVHSIYDQQALLPEVVGKLSELGFEIEDMNETCREWAGRIWQLDLWLRRME